MTVWVALLPPSLVLVGSPPMAIPVPSVLLPALPNCLEQDYTPSSERVPAESAGRPTSKHMSSGVCCMEPDPYMGI